MNQLSQDDEAAFLESLGMTDDQSEVLLNEANDYVKTIKSFKSQSRQHFKSQLHQLSL